MFTITSGLDALILAPLIVMTKNVYRHLTPGGQIAPIFFGLLLSFGLLPRLTKLIKVPPEHSPSLYFILHA